MNCEPSGLLATQLYFLCLVVVVVVFVVVLQVDGAEVLEATQETEEEQNLIQVTDITTDSG